MVMFKPVAATSFQDLVYDQLSDALMTGAFWPGEALNINDLATQFGTSIMPVRDAVRRLAAERALLVEPQKGVRVWRPTKSEFAEITHVRTLLEGDVTAAAVAHLTDKNVRDVARAIDEMNELGVFRSERFLVLNKQIFFTLYEAAQRPATLPIIQSLWRQIGPIVRLYSLFEGFPPTVETSLAFVEALRRRDGEAAREIRIKQILRPSEILMSRFDEILDYRNDSPRHLAHVKPIASALPGEGTKRPGRPRRVR